MADIPRLTDRAALGRNRARTRSMAEPALFLHAEMAAEAEERLAEVKRTFTSVAIVTPFPEIWSGRFPGDARMVGDDEALALQPGAHDLVIHALCLHWANDPVGQLIQARRALRPDGLLLVALFAGLTLHELRGALAAAETDVLGGLSPRIAPMADIRDLGGLLQRAGLTMPVADTTRREVSYTDAWHLMRDLRAMGEGNALAARHRRAPPRRMFARAAELYAAHHAGADGRIPATFEIVWLTGWSPGPDQPRALRPGSATRHLSEAVWTEGAEAGGSPAAGSDGGGPIGSGVDGARPDDADGPAAPVTGDRLPRGRN